MRKDAKTFLFLTSKDTKVFLIAKSCEKDERGAKTLFIFHIERLENHEKRLICFFVWRIGMVGVVGMVGELGLIFVGYYIKNAWDWWLLPAPLFFI